MSGKAKINISYKKINALNFISSDFYFMKKKRQQSINVNVNKLKIFKLRSFSNGNLCS